MLVRSTRRRWRTAPSYVVLVISLAGTVLGAQIASRSAHESDMHRFEEAIDQTVHAISSRMMEYVSALYGARALLEANGLDDRASFHSYVESLELTRRAPGVQGLGFAQVLRPEELAAHEAAVRDEGFSTYRVWPEGARSLYTAIVYLEPFDLRNRRAFGYDMYSEPVRRAAMERARLTGSAVASGVVTLVQENRTSPAQPGILIYLPLYSGDADRHLLGWVYAPFRTHDLFSGIFDHPSAQPPQANGIDIEIYDGQQLEPSANLYDRNAAPDLGGKQGDRLQRAVVMEIAGRPWTVLFTAHEAFLRGSARSSAKWVLGLGLLVSALLFAIVRFQIRGRIAAEEREQRQKFLVEAGRLLSQSLQYEQTLPQVAGICVKSLADWCTVHLLLESGEIQTAALAHRDPERVRWAHEFKRRFLPRAGVASEVQTVIHSGAPVLVPHVAEASLAAVAQEAEAREQLRAAQIASYICVPLVARGQSIGALSLLSSVPGRYSADDLATAQEVAHLAAAAVDNARQYRRAQEAVRVRDEFLSVASHELKTPLTSIVLKLAALRRLAPANGSGMPEKWARAYEVLDRQTGRLVRLVDGLLDISRLAAGRLRLELSDVDLAEVAREVTAATHDEISLAGCTLELDAPAAVVGHWDRMRIEQVISNLLSNAVKYGHGRPIHVSVRGDEGFGQIVVRDEGIGIAVEDLHRVFERFERAAPSANYGGLGLGLYIAKQIVEAMGGRISVASQTGQGSTFTIELPRCGPQAQAQASERALSASA